MAIHVLDMRGTKCPLPLLRAQKKMLELGNGDVLSLLATDPMTPIDLADYCQRHGHELTQGPDADGAFKLEIISRTAKNRR